MILPLAGFFGGTAAISELVLCMSPSDSISVSDAIGSGLVEEFIPGNGFKLMTVREFVKYGVSTYDD